MRTHSRLATETGEVPGEAPGVIRVPGGFPTFQNTRLQDNRREKGQGGLAHLGCPEPQAPGAGRERRGDGPAGPRDGPDAAALQGEATITGRAGSGRRRGARSLLAGGGGDIAAARSVTGVQPQTRHTAPSGRGPAPRRPRSLASGSAGFSA